MVLKVDVKPALGRVEAAGKRTRRLLCCNVRVSATERNLASVRHLP
jgi:hypothetical protein